MRSRILTFLTIVVVLFFMPKRLLAQDRPAPIVEAVVGRSGFLDEAWDYFTTVGGGVRWFVTPRTALRVAVTRALFDVLRNPSSGRDGNPRWDNDQRTNALRPHAFFPWYWDCSKLQRGVWKKVLWGDPCQIASRCIGSVNATLRLTNRWPASAASIADNRSVAAYIL